MHSSKPINPLMRQCDPPIHLSSHHPPTNKSSNLPTLSYHSNQTSIHHPTQTRPPSATPPKPDLHPPLHPNQTSIHNPTQTRPPSRTTGSRSPRLHPP